MRGRSPSSRPRRPRWWCRRWTCRLSSRRPSMSITSSAMANWPRRSPSAGAAEVRRIQEIVSATTSSPADALVTALALTGIRGESVGLDESRLGPAAWQDLVGHLSGLEAVPAAEHLAEARRVKTVDRGARSSPSHRRGGADVVIQALERGMTERDAAMLYTGEIIKRGASPSRAVVAMGDRTWTPAPRPTDRALRSGDLVSSTWARWTGATAEAWRGRRCSASLRARPSGPTSPSRRASRRQVTAVRPGSHRRPHRRDGRPRRHGRGPSS